MEPPIHLNNTSTSFSPLANNKSPMGCSESANLTIAAIKFDALIIDDCSGSCNEANPITS
jgi:hypothetical protein